jgi:hypothetical protein
MQILGIFAVAFDPVKLAEDKNKINISSILP